MQPGQIHHVEYYVDDLARTEAFWGWCFARLGWKFRSRWADGIDWAHPSGSYVVFARAAAEYRGQRNDRQAAGLNHLAFQAGPAGDQADWVRELPDHGAQLLHDDPGYLCFEDPNGFAVEIYF